MALASNSGQHDRNRFAVLPEFGANLRYQLSPLWRVNVGYTLLIVSNVVGTPNEEIKIGLPVRVLWEDINEDVAFPRFEALRG